MFREVKLSRALLRCRYLPMLAGNRPGAVQSFTFTGQDIPHRADISYVAPHSLASQTSPPSPAPPLSLPSFLPALSHVMPCCSCHPSLPSNGYKRSGIVTSDWQTSIPHPLTPVPNTAMTQVSQLRREA